MSATKTVEAVGEVAAELGEGPCWDADTATLVWVDIPGGAIHRTVPETGATTTVRRSPPVSLALPTERGLLVALREQLVLLDEKGGSTLVAALPAEPGVRFNDGARDRSGRLWIGTMHTSREPGAAALYRLDRGGRLTRMLRGVTVSNGLDWSPNGRTLYYVDTPTLRIDAFDYEPHSGTITARRPFADLTDSGGRPDGLTVDAAGGVWVALFSGGALRRYTPEGNLDLIVPLPVTHPTSCAFGGADLGDLYVTTAREPLSAAARTEQPLAGRLLRLRPSVPGLPITTVGDPR